jgi:outer membrane protein TolC
VVTAQAAALSARRSLLQLQSQRQQTAIGLIQALGGGWIAPWADSGNQGSGTVDSGVGGQPHGG